MADDIVEEKKEEVVVPVPPKATDINPIDKNEEKSDILDIDLDEKPEPLSASEKIKYGKDKFAEFDDDIFTDDEPIELDEKTSRLLDKVLDRGRDYKKKSNEYKTVAEANKTISEDPNIKFWADLHDSDDDKVVLASEQAKYLKVGKSEDEALRLAQADVEELKAESEKLFAKKAKDVRLELEGAIHARSQEIQSNISKTVKALSLSNAPDSELISKTIDRLSKTDNFLGLKIGGKNETAKKDFIKPVEAAIKDGSLLKRLQSDPDLLAEFGLYAQYKDKFTKAIDRRGQSKANPLEKLSKAPHSNGKPAIQTDIVPSADGGLKNPTSFR